ncbi:hypothetical protein FNH22_05260 [Fulvivirga sp. M361]|uniref:hypothetical protein n=1 Tax=Fulvivirga sp. M361 TaxID=2594266 RepID=UPI00117B0241|nr:hypothetical protein [Fulvivirga sp. M361]TRX61464.1 hypothetical protein FNH22_05260 [Fulvivirga sp. M361]
MIKKLISITILGTILACETQKPNPLIGSWGECRRDGTYKEYKINKHYTTTSVSDFQNHDYDNGMSFYKCHILDGMLIVTQGINVDLINPPETLRFEFITYNKVILKNSYGTSELTRIENEGHIVDSINLVNWRESYLKAFLQRSEQADCPDVRTDEEKNPLIELGEVEDDFEELTEIEE